MGLPCEDDKRDAFPSARAGSCLLDGRILPLLVVNFISSRPISDGLVFHGCSITFFPANVDFGGRNFCEVSWYHKQLLLHWLAFAKHINEILGNQHERVVLLSFQRGAKRVTAQAGCVPHGRAQVGPCPLADDDAPRVKNVTPEDRLIWALQTIRRSSPSPSPLDQLTVIVPARNQFEIINYQGMKAVWLLDDS